MTERFKVPVLKTGVGNTTVGSNPTLSGLIFQNANFVFLTSASIFN